MNEHRRFIYEHSLVLIRATATFEHAALCPPLVLNGLALLASFVHPEFLNEVAYLWLLGTIMAYLAIVFGYYSQLNFRHRLDIMREAEDEDWEVVHEGPRSEAVLQKEHKEKRGRQYRRLAEIIICTSFLLFVVGALLVCF